jgi:hypothetical protein
VVWADPQRPARCTHRSGQRGDHRAVGRLDRPHLRDGIQLVRSLIRAADVDDDPLRTGLDGRERGTRLGAKVAPGPAGRPARGHDASVHQPRDPSGRALGGHDDGGRVEHPRRHDALRPNVQSEADERGQRWQRRRSDHEQPVAAELMNCVQRCSGLGDRLPHARRVRSRPAHRLAHVDPPGSAARRDLDPPRSRLDPAAVDGGRRHPAEQGRDRALGAGRQPRRDGPHARQRALAAERIERRRHGAL